ncbi:MAG: PKD domain-containing protein [Bacteroidales bacterium]|nr:PKD domain-containing protein [Bacteroidales bacterium]
MSLGNENMNFDELLRSKLENIEFPYDPKGWEKLEKSLPQGKTVIPRKFILSAAAVVLLVAVVTTYLYVNNKNNTTQSNDKRNNTEVNKKDNVNTYNNDVKNANDNVSSQQNNGGNENNVVKSVPVNTSGNQEYGQNATVAPVKSTNDNNNNVEKNNPVTQNNPEKTANSQRNPNAAFTINAKEGCTPFRVTFTPEEKCDSAVYKWNFGNGATSSQASPSFTYYNDGNYNVSLTVKYKKTKRTSTSGLALTVKQSPSAEFNWDVNDGKYSFSPSNRNSDKYIWNFGDARNSDELYPEHQFSKSAIYNVQLTVIDKNGCSASNTKKVDAIIKLFRMANAFSPNGDGVYDVIGPEGNLSNCEFRMIIYDRAGNKVFETTDYTRKWDGIIQKNGQKAAPGVYAYEIFVKDGNGNIDNRPGSITLLL